MSDPDGDGIYTLTVSVPAGTSIQIRQWKQLGSGRKCSCRLCHKQQSGAYCNCCHQQSTVCFGSCSPCSQAPPQTLYDLTLQVDMRQVSAFSQWGTCCS